jgi:hypothetical protein
MMMFATIALLFLSTVPILISSLQCNVCREGIQLNYTMTNTTVPPIPSNCDVINAELCWASIFWELDFNRTYLEFHARPRMAINAPSRDMVSVRIVKGMGRNNQTLLSDREVNYECDSSDKCNGQAALQKLLSSLSVEDQFQQEIAPLLKIISPFDARAADCLYFHNTTYHCPPPDLRRCRRCIVEAAQPVSLAEYVCATCELDESRDNYVERLKTFVLNNRTADIDVAILGCQLKGCNTVNNANIVYKASKITFNSDQYFKN